MCANDCKCSRDNGFSCLPKHGGARDNKFLILPSSRITLLKNASKSVG
jgi:hypothetical protein